MNEKSYDVIEIGMGQAGLTMAASTGQAEHTNALIKHHAGL